jgi:hypothetical protein
MADIKVSIINSSTVLKDSDVAQVVPDLQVQVSRDFAAAWGIDADLTFYPNSRVAPKNSWWLVILDTSDSAGALGYHDLTSEGLPMGKVFALSTMQDNSHWTLTLSHELLEMLGDPDINLGAFVQHGKHAGKLYGYEVCDACEDDQFGYKIGNTLVSDFVFPAWFESFHHRGVQLDQCGHIKKPFQLLTNGYISVYDIKSGGGWSQIDADESSPRYSKRPRIGSRRERRRTPRDQWLRSKPVPPKKKPR